MRLGSELDNIERQRAGELALLRSRLGALTESLAGEGSPAQWVREHPYVATAGAALAGFAAAQLPGWGRGSTGAATWAEGSRGGREAAWEGLLITLAKQVLPAVAASAGGGPDAVVCGGDAGAVRGYEFPGAASFSRGVPAKGAEDAGPVLH